MDVTATTRQGDVMEQVVSFSIAEVRERWKQIVTVFVDKGIEPDAITYAALTLGVASLAGSFDIENDAPPQRRIGFIWSD
jgi:hypothetical protein